MAASESIPRAWFRRVWNELDVAAIDELFAANGEAYGIDGEVIAGPQGFREFHASFREMFSDIVIDVVDEVASDNRTAVRCKAKMVHRPTGKPVDLSGTAFFALNEGQIQRAWNHWDFLGLLESMQLLPTRSFEKAITGKLPPHADA